MSHVIMMHDIVEANGKTIKENNLEKTHNIPVGALVELVGDPEHPAPAHDGIRAFVAIQSRDCDGTPLYWLTLRWQDIAWDNKWPEGYDRLRVHWTGGFSEESLRMLRQLPREGHDYDAYLRERGLK